VLECPLLGVRRAKAALAAAGHKVSVASFDVTLAQACREGVAAIEQDSGAIDILVNNAGMQFRSPLEDFPVEKWEQLLATNVSSAFYVGQAVARHMIPRRRGKIIKIASVQSELARPGIAPYTATKNLTHGMCADWAKYRLQINAIAPGYFRTPLNQALVDDSEFSNWLEKRTPAARWGNVDELVGAAVFLSGKASPDRAIQTPGANSGLDKTWGQRHCQSRPFYKHAVLQTAYHQENPPIRG
jgi:gluconate 5-dehydrogenase